MSDFAPFPKYSKTENDKFKSRRDFFRALLGFLQKKYIDTDIAEKLGVNKSTVTRLQDHTPGVPRWQTIAKLVVLVVEEIEKEKGQLSSTEIQEYFKHQLNEFIGDHIDQKHYKTAPKFGKWRDLKIHTSGSYNAGGDNILFDPLPHEIPPFFGRDKIIDKIIQKLRPGSVVHLRGVVGSGKTSLIWQLVSILAPEGETSERFPDGITYEDMKQQPNVEELLKGIAHKLVSSPAEMGIANAIKLALRKKHLIILDNAEYAQNLSSILMSRGNRVVLLSSTTQAPYGKEQDDEIVLGDLEPNHARELLQYEAMATPVDPYTANKICQYYSCIPALVAMAGRWINRFFQKHPPEFLEWLEDKDIPLREKLTFRGELKSSIPDTIDVLLPKCDEIIQTVLFILARKDDYGRYSDDELAQEIGKSNVEIRMGLTEEKCRGLIIQSPYGSYMICHQLYYKYLHEVYTHDK